ncbi:hypothetical protein ABZ553_19810 [Streptomyces sparsogenes]
MPTGRGRTVGRTAETARFDQLAVGWDTTHATSRDDPRLGTWAALHRTPR